MIKEFKDLEVYKVSYDLAVRLHKLSIELPQMEQFELGRQLRRAATSIPLNIAEGYGRKKSAADFKHFLSIALGSCNEVRVLLDMLKDIGYLEEPIYDGFSSAYQVLGRRLFALIERWK